MHADDFFDAQLAVVFDDNGEPLLDDGHAGKVRVHGGAHEFRAEDARRGDVLENFPRSQLPQFGEVAAGKRRVLHVAHQALSLHLRHVFPLRRDGARRGEHAFLLALLRNEVKGVVAARTVFLAGVAGDAFGQHAGILSLHDFHHFPVRFLVPAKGHVLAFEQAVGRAAACANLLIEFQLNHEAPPSMNDGIHKTRFDARSCPAGAGRFI